MSYTQTILVTGGTNGLGYFTALHVGKLSPSSQIVIASRTDKDNAAQELSLKLDQYHKLNRSHSPQVVYMRLDLASLDKVRQFGSEFQARNFPRLSSLCLNAALQFFGNKELEYTPDGVESTFGINHVGHALLFYLLKPCLANDARIVIVASGTHDPAQKSGAPDAEYTTAEEMAHPKDGLGYGSMKGLQRYASSKLCNVLWTYALEKRLQKAREGPNGIDWRLCAFDPGFMPATSLGRDYPGWLQFIGRHIMPRMLWLIRVLARSNNVHTPDVSGANLARHVVNLSKDQSGSYFEGSRAIPSSKASHNQEKQEDLYEWTMEFVSKDKGELEMFNSF